MNVLWTLIRKDWRVVKPAVLTGAGFFAVPIIIQGVVNLLKPSTISDPGLIPAPNFTVMEMKANDFREAAVIGFFLWSLAATVVAGCMFARERRERSAELMELLPVSRGTRLASKVVLGAVVLIGSFVALAGAWAAAHVFWLRGVPHRTYLEGSAETMTLLAALLLAMAGTAWLLSAALRSEALATAFALGGVILGALLLALIPGPGTNKSVYAWIDAGMPTPGHGQALVVLCLAVAVAGFVSGCVVALKRREA